MKKLLNILINKSNNDVTEIIIISVFLIVIMLTLIVKENVEIPFVYNQF